MPGAALTDALVTPRHLGAAFSALAAFHRRLAHHVSKGTSPGLQARLRELEWLIGGGFSQIGRVLARHDADPVTGMARRWVEVARAQAPPFLETLKRAAGVNVERQPCLRDARPEHFLFDGGRVAGLVDFGAMGFDSVAADLARLASEWSGRDHAPRSVGLDAYAAVRPLGPDETSLIEVFERSAALLGPGHWVRWHYLDGRSFEDPLAVTHGLEKGLRRLLPDEAG